MGYPAKEVDNEQVIRYIPLVKRIVSRIEVGSGDLDKDDLFSIGIIGLMDALKKFDITKGVPFEAYATLRIKGTVVDGMRKTGRVSRDRIVKLNEYYDAKERLEKLNNRTPEEYEICEELEIGEKELSKLHESVHHLSKVSLDGVVFRKDGNEMHFSDIIEDRQTDTPEEQLLKAERKKMLGSAMKKLEEREQMILELYYVQEMTLQEIAYILDISTPRVSQLHGKILLKLRDIMSDERE